MTYDKMLSKCDIPQDYTIEDISSNREGSFEKVLRNEDVVDYIISDSDAYLEAITSSETAMQMIAASDENAIKFLGNTDWFYGIVNSQYANVFDAQATQVPILGGMNEYIIYNTEVYLGWYEPFRAFDGNIHSSINGGEGNGRSWYGGASECFIGYEFSEEIGMYKFSITNSGHALGEDLQYGVKDVGLQYCNAEGEWVEVKRYENQKDLLATTVFYNENINIKSKKWRMYIYNKHEGGNPGFILGELKFYGRK